ncbi:MAG: CPBP family intramembrane glutamic endopeptidase [Armatimonadota bacterium]
MELKNFLLLCLVNVILAPIFEESVFRGLLYVPLCRKVGRYFALIITSLLWTHSHFSSIIHSVGIFVFGIILGALYEKSGSLLPSLILHMYKNSWIVAYYFNLS